MPHEYCLADTCAHAIAHAAHTAADAGTHAEKNCPTDASSHPNADIYANAGSNTCANADTDNAADPTALALADTARVPL